MVVGCEWGGAGERRRKEKGEIRVVLEERSRCGVERERSEEQLGGVREKR